jgi:cytochrome c heme-lyase
MSTLAQAPSPDQSSVNNSTLNTDRVFHPSRSVCQEGILRKGWETPEEHVETMVEIHNFLNEEAWQEVLKLEKRSNR